MKKNVKIESNQNRTLIIDPPYSKEFKPGLVLILDKLLGRVAPDQNLVYLLLTVLPDESIDQFCEKVRRESFTSNKILCSANYYLQEIADICQGLEFKHHHMRLNKIMVEVFEEAYINKDLELPFYDRLMELQSLFNLEDEEINLLHILIHIFRIEKLQALAYEFGIYDFCSFITEKPLSLVMKYLGPTAPLFEKGILKDFIELNHMLDLTPFAFSFIHEGKGLLDNEMPVLLATAKNEYAEMWEENSSLDSPETR